MSYTSDFGKLAHLKNNQRYELRARTLVEALESRRRHRPEFMSFMDMKNQAQVLTAGDALDGALAVAQHLMSLGLKKEDKVMVMLPTSVEFVHVYFGILMAGAVPVPVSQPAGTSNIGKYLENLQHIIRDSESKFFITYDKIKMLIGGLMAVPNLVKEFIFTEEMMQNPVPQEKYVGLPAIGPDDLALIQYTSGTTGRPKGVTLSHGNLLHNIHGIGLGLAITESDVGISWLPLYHDMGLIGGMLTAIYWEIKMIMMMPEAFLLRPQWWLENITRFGATMGVAPNFGYHYCVTRIPDSTLGRLDLSSWRLALNGAEPVDRVTLQRFLERFGHCGLRKDIFLPVYGMAENSLAATFPSLGNTTVARRFRRDKLEEEHLAVDSDSADSKSYIDLVSVGYPLVGQEVRVVDDRGVTLRERQVGEILVKSPSSTAGYYKNARATAEAIRDGWLHTGDMGFVLEGMLFISGRMKEIIIKRGKNIYPYDVERIASTVKGVRIGCCAAFAVENLNAGTEDLILVCETLLKDQKRLEELKKSIKAEILVRLGITPDDIRLVPKGTIPKTTSGKLQRLLCKKIYLEDDNGFHLLKRRNGIVLIRTMIRSSLHLLKRQLLKPFRKNGR
ncbi:MAG: fatty acyl-AMP ligase [Spirochaetes bacterium]|nr:fatty acyl-AMP ligase [Spirochaetota bacterium]